MGGRNCGKLGPTRSPGFPSSGTNPALAVPQEGMVRIGAVVGTGADAD